MEVYKKIVVPYDGSTHSQLALEHAAFLAKISGGTISVLYVASLTSAATRISGFFGNYDAGAVADRVREKGEEILHKAKATVPAEIATEELFEVGSPGAVITDVAERVGANRSLGFGQHVCAGTYEDSGHCCKISLLRFRSAA